ncbi:MAG: hypothetical protein ACUVTL_01020 [Thermoproteota archaeon]
MRINRTTAEDIHKDHEFSLKRNSIAAKFDEDDFILTFVLLSTIFILISISFQILSTPHQKYLIIYAINDEGNFISSDVTKLHLGDKMKILIVIENHMKRSIDVKLQTVIAGGLTSYFTNEENFTLNEQLFTLSDKERSIVKIEFAVTKARFDKSSIMVEQVDLNDYKSNIFIESPYKNQTLRLIFNLLIWSNEEGRYVKRWSDGTEDRTSWLQIWFELIPEVER